VQWKPPSLVKENWFWLVRVHLWVDDASHDVKQLHHVMHHPPIYIYGTDMMNYSQKTADINRLRFTTVKFRALLKPRAQALSSGV
jgi:hypothetical protein